MILGIWSKISREIIDEKIQTSTEEEETRWSILVQVIGSSIPLSIFTPELINIWIYLHSIISPNLDSFSYIFSLEVVFCKSIEPAAIRLAIIVKLKRSLLILVLKTKRAKRSPDYTVFISMDLKREIIWCKFSQLSIPQLVAYKSWFIWKKVRRDW